MAKFEGCKRGSLRIYARYHHMLILSNLVSKPSHHRHNLGTYLLPKWFLRKGAICVTFSSDKVIVRRF